jgi:hypothetical protein
MAVMKPPPSLHVVPGRSRGAVALVLASHAATAMLLVSLPLPLLVRIAGTLAIAVAGMRVVRDLAGRNAPASLSVGIDGWLRIIRCDGREEEGEVLADTYVGRRLTTIVWRARGARRARTLLVLADALPADEFRRLRVLLRYGRTVDVGPGTSGVDAG